MSERKRGRPPLCDEPTTDIHVRVSVSQYDRVYREASRTGESIPTVIRRAIDRETLRDDRREA